MRDVEAAAFVSRKWRGKGAACTVGTVGLGYMRGAFILCHLVQWLAWNARNGTWKDGNFDHSGPSGLGRITC